MKFIHEIRGKVVVRLYKGWIKRGQRVLDVGCGDGTVSGIIKKKFGCDVKCTDIRNYIRNDLPFSLMKDDKHLPFKNKSFDIVMLNDVLHHTEKQSELFRECLRVGKRVLVVETQPSIIETILDYVLNWLHRYNDMPIPLTQKRFPEWISFFRKYDPNVKGRICLATLYPSPYPLTHFSFNIG